MMTVTQPWSESKVSKTNCSVYHVANYLLVSYKYDALLVAGCSV